MTSSADTIVIESAQISVYLTTDVPRTRAYSVNRTYTPNVRFPGTVCSGFADKPVRKLISLREFNPATPTAAFGGHLVAGGDYTGFEIAHIFPLSETDIVSYFSCIHANFI